MIPHSRRSFLTQLAAAGVVAPAWLLPTAQAAASVAVAPAVAGFAAARAAGARVLTTMPQRSGEAVALAADEGFWRDVQASWAVDRSILNLENGGIQPSTALVNHAFIEAWQQGHEAPAYTLNRVLMPQLDEVRTRLASAFGCDREELALTRNTTEGIETVLLGLALRAGDEVVTTSQDYWRFQNTLLQRSEREGIVLRSITLSVPVESTDEIVARFATAITPRTRVILMSHIINLTGQVLPVREVVRMARARGVLVVVDGAHGFAQLPGTRESLDCDIYATSLHKWLGAPHGTGFLYVRRERIGEIWPLYPAPVELRENIRKFESIGSLAAAPYLGIRPALDFWLAIGAERKMARLRWLRDRWLHAFLDDPTATIHTPRSADFSAALVTIDFAGLVPSKLAGWLWERHRTLVRPVVHKEFRGIRVTPNLYTTEEELARFVEILRAARLGSLA